MVQPMKIFDCFLFFNELELLELRLMELYDHVDHFVLAEANVTNNGLPKEFIFEKNKDRYKEYLDKIIYVKIEDCPPHDIDNPLRLEEFKRNAIRRGYENIAKEGDVIMVSDVDEIPNMDIVKAHLHKCHGSNWIHFQCDLFYYYVNCQVVKGFGGTTIAKYGTFGSSPNRLKLMAVRKGTWTKGNNNVIMHAGWHYSYLCGGDPDRVKEKVETSGESYPLARFINNREEIVEKIKNHKDLFNRNGDKGIQEIVDISNNKPRSMDKFLEKYPQFFYKEK
jgi:beta-1,4-mannosyl-glycoprotein beta-1,4-N-acetylglucosaminyltransferase